MNHFLKVFVRAFWKSFHDYGLRAQAITERELAARERQIEQREKTLDVAVVKEDTGDGTTVR